MASIEDIDLLVTHGIVLTVDEQRAALHPLYDPVRSLVYAS